MESRSRLRLSDESQSHQAADLSVGLIDSCDAIDSRNRLQTISPVPSKQQILTSQLPPGSKSAADRGCEIETTTVRHGRFQLERRRLIQRDGELERAVRIGRDRLNHGAVEGQRNGRCEPRGSSSSSSIDLDDPADAAALTGGEEGGVDVGVGDGVEVGVSGCVGVEMAEDASCRNLASFELVDRQQGAPIGSGAGCGEPREKIHDETPVGRVIGRQQVMG